MNKTEDDTELVTSDEARAAGLRRIPRRHVEKHNTVTLADCRVEVTLQLDADVLDYFERRAQLPYAASYEAQINRELRAVMEGDSGSPYAALVNDDDFIAALATRLRQYPAEKAV